LIYYTKNYTRNQKIINSKNNKYEEYLKAEYISLEEEDAKIIFNMYVKEFFTNKNYISFKFEQDIFNNDYLSLYEFSSKEDRVRMYKYLKYAVILNSFLLGFKGKENYYKYLNFLYNESYVTLDDIFISCYNMKFTDILKELDEVILKY